jgi:hypothetical protein
MKERRLYLTNTWVQVIFIYYFIIFVIGLFLSVLGLTPNVFGVTGESILLRAMEGSVGMALNGSSIFYIRKLYKLCFGNRLDSSVEGDIYLERLGTIVYFLARPLFSVGFALLIVIGIRSGFILAVSSPVQLNDGFVFTTMFLSFFVGFLAGRFIVNLEKKGENYLQKIEEGEAK